MSQEFQPGWRRLVVVAGAAAWGRRELADRLSAQASTALFWIGETAPAGITAVAPAQVRTLLGRQCDALVFDAHSGLDPDALAAAAGTLAGGGTLWLLTPPLESWPQAADPVRARIRVHPYAASDVGGRYLQRLVILLQAAEVEIWREGAELALPDLPPWRPEPQADGCLSADQSAALEAICQRMSGRAHRPLVISADRGRGKSAALGLAAARLLREQRGDILITAPGLAAVATLFTHAQAQLPEAQASRGQLRWGEHGLRFVPPDELLRQRPEARVLMIDEAAAIPAPLLHALLRHYPRVVFATTVQGYEGSGRGFALRFRQVLKRETPAWHEISLQTPIRWAANDPLEALLHGLLCLDAEPAAVETDTPVDLDALAMTEWDRDALGRDESRLRQLFGLLVQAHYRTTPMDLRQLLDGPNLRLWGATHGGQVVATALVAMEGGFDEALAQAVYQGERRPPGNLLPQTLAAHAGLPAAAQLSMARVIRIAVHPALQRQGIGTALLERLQADLQGTVDGLGASFGATPELLGFWSAHGCEPLWLGLKRGASSGQHAAVVLRPLSPPGDALVAEAQARFKRHLPTLLSEPLRDLDARLIEALWPVTDTHPQWHQVALREVRAFALGKRGYEVSMPVLRPLLVEALGCATMRHQWSESERQLLWMKVIQQRSWPACVRTLEAKGRAELERRLRAACTRLLPPTEVGA